MTLRKVLNSLNLARAHPMARDTYSIIGLGLWGRAAEKYQRERERATSHLQSTCRWILLFLLKS